MTGSKDPGRTVLLGAWLAVAVALARPVPANTAAETGVLMHATTVAPAGETWTISLSRWPTDTERAPLLAALASPPARQGGPAGMPGGPAGIAGGPATAPGRGATAGGPNARGGAATAPAGAADAARGAATGAGGGAGGAAPGSAAPGSAAPGGAGPGGAGPAGGRAGRGGARGGGRGAAAPASPMARLGAAIKAAPTVGFIWGGGVTGYSIRYAWRSPGTRPPERVVLVTDRRLALRSPPPTTAPTTAAVATGVAASAAFPAAVPAADADADFTVLEIRFDATGKGEARSSLTSGVVVDEAAGTVALDGYGSAPVILKVSR